MNKNTKIIQKWEEQEALHRFQLIAPLLREDMDDAKRLQLRKRIADENDISVRSLYRKSLKDRGILRTKTCHPKKTAFPDASGKL